ncbi:putative multicopper oxidase [Streptomyces sp. NBRC 110611]|uniref:multicopper oxidase family protein n=1 Tax=Streptomyces sp. NBRC 110611 TaxID=1621259 RepID=UPI00082DAEB1|nr:multicopper oxidase family protein [Streptomyces sp. NBRC 110611]GAU69444.1 putative multicopper oxidase [Streptomyces sp. NBRC 110611]
MRTHSRRALLGAGIAAAGSGLLTAGSPPAAATDHRTRRPYPDGSRDSLGPHGSPGSRGSGHDTPRGYVDPAGPEVVEAERRRGTGPVRRFSLTADQTTFDLGGYTVDTWAYNDQLPGPEIRVTRGDRIAMTLHNRLPQSTTVHWHGLHLRNDMDGVPDLTQRACKTDHSFDYVFTASTPGTHWVHPHVGVQVDRGLYAPLIVEDPDEPLSYDKEWIVMIDDWLDGVDGVTPDEVLEELNKDKPGGAMGHGEMQDEMQMGGRAGGRSSTARALLTRHSQHRKDDFAANVEHPFHLMNGRSPDDRETFRAKPGDRIRIRLINASGDTAYRVALGDHIMTVTHSDGFPVEHKKTDSLVMGMAERYDVLITAKDGVFPLTALSAGKSNNKTAQALLRTGDGEAPDPKHRPKELRSGGIGADKLKAAEEVRLSNHTPDRTIKMDLTGTDEKWDWAINGEPYTPSQRYPVREGERVRLVFHNKTKMWHPMHLHGHTFALPDGGPRKDTTILLPDKKVCVDFDADNPGLWMVHCHNIYHSESGMMTVIGYRS